MIRHLLAALVSAEVRRLRRDLADARRQRDIARRVAVRWYTQARPGLTVRGGRR